MEIAAALLTVLSLVKAGLAFEEIVTTVRDMADNGATDSEVHDYLKQLRDQKLKELGELTKE